MEDVAVPLDLHVLADRHGPRPRDPAEIVPAEVDEHDVLRSLFRVALELLGEELILAVVGAARSRARDRMGREAIAFDLEEELRARADDLEGRRSDEEQVRAGIYAAERAIQRDAIERPPRRRVAREIERLSPGKHDLDRLA